jgi:hypothetical protein
MINDRLEMINGGITEIDYRKITIVYNDAIPKSIIYHLSSKIKNHLSTIQHYVSITVKL